MRVALASHAFSWENAGGGEVLVRLLAGHLAAMGHEVHVLTADARGAAEPSPFAVRVVPSLSTLAFRAALREVRPDVVDVHNMEASVPVVLAARSLRLPVVVTANSAWPTCLFADMYRPGHGLCETCSVAG
ncbi:MAG TPA: glycosyltransferase, partial [Candidatus Thermoplasmatota archaeon]|nr:glycosyltransferase [Candidatus Thermoplasmatota archaeon]